MIKTLLTPLNKARPDNCDYPRVSTFGRSTKTVFAREQEAVMSEHVTQWTALNVGPRLAWFHPEKTGTSFGTTLIHDANRSLPPHAAMPPCYMQAQFMQF